MSGQEALTSVPSLVSPATRVDLLTYRPCSLRIARTLLRVLTAALRHGAALLFRLSENLFS